MCIRDRPHRVQAVSFIEQACILKQQPSYTIIQKEQYNDAIKQIIEIAASRNHDGSFMRAIQRESLTTLRTPIAGSVMHFLYCLANHQWFFVYCKELYLIIVCLTIRFSFFETISARISKYHVTFSMKIWKTFKNITYILIMIYF